MEHFKNATRKLYAKRPLFFNIGLVIAISLCFIAFEFKVFIAEEEKVELPEEEPYVFLNNDVIRTSQPPKPQPQPKKLPEPKGDVNIVEVKELPKKDEQKEMIDIDQTLESLAKEFKMPDEKVEDNSIHMSSVLEVAPQFNGGLEAFYQYIADAIEYPSYEQNRNIEGRVVLSFVIEKDGSLSQVEVLKGVSKGIDKEAIRVIKNAPKWEAGRQRGQAVRVRMNIPIYFQLR
ncbi:protein TonB [Marivirga tractuosa]|uniref:TonB family protein n=1 Tax=Marivirga tractuosa (strain ATCC 23168 / DSM 4126 / NBRC 15989 / NCIMB 1408 / VKM B-1430 / H-43) TaxID=643867 RepID=E4TSA3_MARTH|nr:energy transducer TonB [Marivirga tractuosa]ADR22820.1 TonB family protein [Marivirga tractuosa DSM 4126]BDD16509.1 protein TonB [Marivirga tractuosa]